MEEFSHSDNKNKDTRKRSLCLKYAAAISASITTAGFGIMISWTSPALPHLKSPASEYPVSSIQAAWIASLNGCGTITGYLLNTFLIDRLGRKRTLLHLAVPQVLSWILIYLGRNWFILCFSRIIGGIGYGGGLCATAVYLAEIGDENTRGIFLTFIKLSINTGIFITMFFGAFLSYNFMNLALLGIPIIFIISFSYMPDSNQFDLEDILEDVDLDDVRGNRVEVYEEGNADLLLEEKTVVLEENTIDVLEENTVDVLKENTVEVPTEKTQVDLKETTVLLLKENTIVVVNETTVDILQESTIDFLNENTVSHLNERALGDLKKSIEGTENAKGDFQETIICSKQDTLEENTTLLKNKTEDPKGDKQQKNILWRLFVVKNNQKALLIILIASLTDIFSGHMAIVSYTQEIFEYSSASLKAEYAALVLAALKIGASLISTLVVERFGRRVLFLSTGIFAGLAQGLVGLFFFLKMYLEVDVSCISWLPLFGVSMYEIVGSVGLSSLYYIYQGELFSNDVKGAGVTCTNIAYESITFFIKFHFQMVIDAVGIYTLFWGFGISCVIGSGLTYWISPETKGKSSEEIQNLLRGD